MIFFMDGITEAMNPEQGEFTQHRLLQFINEYKEQSASGIISGIQDAVL